MIGLGALQTINAGVRCHGELARRRRSGVTPSRLVLGLLILSWLQAGSAEPKLDWLSAAADSESPGGGLGPDTDSDREPVHSIERRQASGVARSFPSSSQPGSSSYYQSVVATASTACPDLSQATLVWQVKNLTVRLDKEIMLPFPFKFFGHVHNSMYISVAGFLYPTKAPANCDYTTNSSCYWSQVFGASHISPFSGQWSVSKHVANSLSYYSHAEFVHVHWNVHPFKVCIGERVRVCNESEGNPRARFGATLHRDGRIVFTYDQIAATYPFMDAERQEGTVSLADSAISSDLQLQRWEFSRYATLSVNISRSLQLVQSSATSSCLLSVTFTPTSTQQCATAASQSECYRGARWRDCTWCRLRDSMLTTTPGGARQFCTTTSQQGDRHTLSKRGLQCLGVLAGNPPVDRQYLHYTTAASDTGFRVPNVAGNTLLANITGLATAAPIRVDLPFVFPFYNRPVRQLDVYLSGYIYPNPASSSSSACGHLPCGEQQRLKSKFIAPLIGAWTTVGSGGGRIEVYRSASLQYVHIVWLDVRLSGAAGSPPTSFSATLSADGSILFNYLRLADYSQYAFPTAVGGAATTGMAGLRDTFGTTAADPKLFYYRDIDLTDKLKSGVTFIAIKSHRNSSCSRAKKLGSCKELLLDSLVSTSEPCFWCEAINPPVGIAEVSFCSDKAPANAMPIYPPFFLCLDPRLLVSAATTASQPPQVSMEATSGTVSLGVIIGASIGANILALAGVMAVYVLYRRRCRGSGVVPATILDCWSGFLAGLQHQSSSEAVYEDPPELPLRQQQLPTSAGSSLRIGGSTMSDEKVSAAFPEAQYAEAPELASTPPHRELKSRKTCESILSRKEAVAEADEPPESRTSQHLYSNVQKPASTTSSPKDTAVSSSNSVECIPPPYCSDGEDDDDKNNPAYVNSGFETV